MTFVSRQDNLERGEGLFGQMMGLLVPMIDPEENGDFYYSLSPA